MSKKTNLIIGEVESGKTRKLGFSEVKKSIAENKNLFILDNKNEYYPRFKEELENKGYKTYLINLREPLKSNGINILKYPYELYKNGNKDAAVSLLTHISKNICVEKEDDFWECSASNYLSSLLLILFENYSIEEVNFMNLDILISLLDTNQGNDLLKNYFNSLKVTDLIYKLGSTTIFAPIDTRGGIISTLRYKVNSFFNRQEVVKTLSIDELSLSNLDNKVAIFYMGSKEINGIANILIEELVNANKYNDKELVLMLDNFNTLPKFHAIEELIEYHAINNTKVYFVTNCLEELWNLYGQYTFKKIANTITTDNTSIELDTTNNVVNYPIRSEFILKEIDTNKLINN